MINKEEKIVLKLEKILKYTKNPNNLPEVDVLALDEIYEDTDEAYEEFYDKWDGVKLKLKDGTNVVLERFSGVCINHRFDDPGSEDFFYHLIDQDIYICASCLTRLKKHESLVREIDGSKYGIIATNTMFPIEWNECGIRSWIKNRLIKQKEYEKRREDVKNYFENIEADNCMYCIHMKKGECKFGLYCEYDEDCGYCEIR